MLPKAYPLKSIYGLYTRLAPRNTIFVASVIVVHLREAGTNRPLSTQAWTDNQLQRPGSGTLHCVENGALELLHVYDFQAL